LIALLFLLSLQYHRYCYVANNELRINNVGLSQMKEYHKNFLVS